MNKKGFTLTELLVVIAILSVIALIAIPSVIQVINEAKIKSYNEQEKSIVNAAKTYMTNHSNELPLENQSVCKTVGQLQNEGLIKSQQIKNPVGAGYEGVTEQNATFNGGVLITLNGKKYTYKYVDDCSNPNGGGSGESFTGTIYRSNLNEVAIGDYLTGGAQKWCVIGTLDGVVYDSCADEQDYYNIKQYCMDMIDYYVSRGEAVAGALSCQLKKVQLPDTPGAGEYTTNVNQITKAVYLKHDVVDGVITTASVCFVKNSNHYCLQGGVTAAFNTNKSLIQTLYGSSVVVDEFGAGYDDEHIYVHASPGGNVNVQSYDNSWGCNVGYSAISNCGESGGFIIA